MGPVLLLHMGPVVLVARAGPGEGDVMLGAIGQQVVVDELTAVVRVDPEDGERELGDHVLDGLEDPDGRLVLDRSVDGPSGGDVSNRQGETELATRVAALVTNQVDLHEPRQIPLHSAHVRTGIWDLSKVPGLVWERPRNAKAARSFANRRSMVAALMDTKRAASASLRSRSPSRR